MKLLSTQTGDNATVGLMESGQGRRDIDEVAIAGRMIFPQHRLNPFGKAVPSDYINPSSTIRFVNQVEKGLAGILLPGMYCYVGAQRHALGPFLISKSAQP